MQQRRHHFKQNDLIERRLADEAKRLREEAELVGGSLRDEKEPGGPKLGRASVNG